ncbi:hypothetical protein pclt_cds_380 [Pandoravirus celtis]|uniref:Uncharacterized protein n=1 Tax=Pandoravirus celtis TaxID=2568002 RepID=A0A4D6EID2_9VIRU|nr:hypothetical protein pclt_cds_380 [Pandoravirus celtis]
MAPLSPAYSPVMVQTPAAPAGQAVRPYGLVPLGTATKVTGDQVRADVEAGNPALVMYTSHGCYYCDQALPEIQRPPPTSACRCSSSTARTWRPPTDPTAIRASTPSRTRRHAPVQRRPHRRVLCALCRAAPGHPLCASRLSVEKEKKTSPPADTVPDRPP